MADEREVLPGVFLTDFRTAATIAANDAAIATTGAPPGDSNTPAQQHRQRQESKAKENDETEEDSPTPVTAAAANSSSAANASSSSSSSSASASASSQSRPHPSAFPLDIPNDVEALELELAALTKNLAQLIRSNEVLQEELRLAPDDADFREAVSENRAVILRRSERMQAIRAQLQMIAPHRVEAVNAQLAQAVADQQAAAARETAALQAPEPEGEGIFL